MFVFVFLEECDNLKIYSEEPAAFLPNRGHETPTISIVVLPDQISTVVVVGDTTLSEVCQ